MKKTLLIALVLVFVYSLSSFAAMESKNAETGLVFLDLPLLSMVHHDSNKQITGFTGINAAIGISHRQFFSPLKTDSWNWHWDIGTLVLILPYVGVGADYVWENGWYVGAGLIYVFPEIHAGYYF